MILTYVAFGIDLNDPESEILAIMPGEPSTVGRPDLATCYAHVGQHSSCSLTGIASRYSQADYDDYEELLCELCQIGYHVIVIRFERIEDSKYRDMRVEGLRGN